MSENEEKTGLPTWKKAGEGDPIGYFFKLDEKISELEEQIVKQKNRIAILVKGKNRMKDKREDMRIHKNQLVSRDRKIAKLERKLKAELVYKVKMEVIIHRMGISEEVRDMRKVIGLEVRKIIGEPDENEQRQIWNDEDYKEHFQKEVPWQIY